MDDPVGLDESLTCAGGDVLPCLVVLVEPGDVSSVQIDLRLSEHHPLRNRFAYAGTFFDPHGGGGPQSLDLRGFTENRRTIRCQRQQTVAGVLLSNCFVTDDVRHEFHRVLVLKIEIFLRERHLRRRQGGLLDRRNLTRLIQDRAVRVRADLQTGSVLPLVHEGVHVADDRPLDIALGIREERDRADVLHLVNRGCQRNRRACHLRDSWAPATTGDHDVLGVDGPAVGHDRGHMTVGHFDVHDLGVGQTRQGVHLLRFLAHDRSRPQ